MPDIDYSTIPTPSVNNAEANWEPPIHKFFGKRLPNGRMEPEPQYRYEAFPSFRYKQVNGSIQARVVRSQAEAQALGEGWTDTPAEFGYVGAPTFEEARAAKMEEVEEAPRRGRPPKA